jgi:hypothetical protein
MTRGFIILRHVMNELTNQYWKECYQGIRTFYDDPIIIIDDSSKKEFLTDIPLENCTVIYDTEHKGAAELLPYYYFHQLKPFDEAIILHDSVFLQHPVDFSLRADEPVRFLWSIPHYWDDEIFSLINKLLESSPEHLDLVVFYHQKLRWRGGFGVMSVMKWEFIDLLHRTHCVFDVMLPKINERDDRSALERVLPLLSQYHYPECMFQMGDIFHYMKFGLTYHQSRAPEYRRYPLLKVWSGR